VVGVVEIAKWWATAKKLQFYLTHLDFALQFNEVTRLLKHNNLTGHHS
jgi:hypothetical protein